MMADLLSRHERVYGKGHHNNLMLVTDYGNYLRVHGDLGQARDLLAEAEDTYRALVGQAHPVPTGMQSNIGLLMQAEGNRDGALVLFEQALTGSAHPARRRPPVDARLRAERGRRAQPHRAAGGGRRAGAGRRCGGPVRRWATTIR